MAAVKEIGVGKGRNDLWARVLFWISTFVDGNLNTVAIFEITSSFHGQQDEAVPILEEEKWKTL